MSIRTLRSNSSSYACNKGCIARLTIDRLTPAIYAPTPTYGQLNPSAKVATSSTVCVTSENAMSESMIIL